jgi:hypothetical protein
MKGFVGKFLAIDTEAARTLSSSMEEPEPTFESFVDGV